MDKITLNGERFIGLADFNHLRRNLIKDVYDRYKRDENGELHLSEKDLGYIDALTHIMGEIMCEDVHDAESPNEIKEMHRELNTEYALHRYVIVGKDEETGERVFFRKYCEHIEEDEFTPVFTSMSRLAKAWRDYYMATVTCEGLKHNTGDNTLRVEPAWIYLLPPGDVEKLLLKAIFCDDTCDREESGGDDA